MNKLLKTSQQYGHEVLTIGRRLPVLRVLLSAFSAAQSAVSCAKRATIAPVVF